MPPISTLRAMYLAGVLGDWCSQRLGLDAVRVERPRVLATHCRRGHPFDDANTYRKPGGGRRCRTCQRDYEHRYRRRAS